MKWVLAAVIRRMRRITLPIQAVGKHAGSAGEIFVIAALLLPGLPVQLCMVNGKEPPESKQPLLPHKEGVHGVAPLL